MLQCVAACCNVLQCVAVCGYQRSARGAQCVAVCCSRHVVRSHLIARGAQSLNCSAWYHRTSLLHSVAGCCRVLQGVAGCCRVLQGVAVYCYQTPARGARSVLPRI